MKKLIEILLKFWKLIFGYKQKEIPILKKKTETEKKDLYRFKKECYAFANN